MSSTNNVSLIGQITSQSQNLATLRQQLNDLSQQATTGQVASDYSGLGTKAEPVLNLNAQQPLIQGYQDNITNVSNKMTLMNNALSQIATVGNNLVSAIQTQLQNSPTNVANVQQIAAQGLQTVEDMLNQNIDGQYLFAGSSSSTPPFADNSTLNSNFNNQIQSWLATGNTSALTTAINGFSATNLGLSAGLATSGNVTTQVDANTNVDYTVKADGSGFQDLIRALTLVANTPYPGASNTATGPDYQNLMNDALTTAQKGVTEVNNTSQSLAGKFAQVKAIGDQNTSDLTVVQNQLSTLTTADTTTAITEMQALQTQLTSSYQVTNIVSKLSLVNYLTF
ncbi:MAG: hypothetical protein KGL10_01635 [Alphaproteobacteria bacterium]|nr:hypothetical protein [Alphaproteobacteria bacterium]MDE2335989.1 hypothetical protein [Alphaproteobacteria bacterium]